MSLTEADLPRASAAASRLRVIERTGSTNADLITALGAEPGEWPHLAVLVTDDQTAGRGRLDRSWTTPQGSALAISVVLRTDSLPTAARGWIPLIAGAAMARAIRAQLAAHDVRVKWPNDVLVDGLKISGILAEAAAGTDAVVVGAGVNTAMAAADLPVPTAVSFAAVGEQADADRLIADYLIAMAELFAGLLAAGGDAESSGVRAEVAAHCTTIDSAVRVQLPGGGELIGAAVRIGGQGELVVRTHDGEVSVTAGDVIHVR